MISSYTLSLWLAHTVFALTIGILVSLLILIATSLISMRFAATRAVPGYEDEAGFHERAASRDDETDNES